MHKAKSDVSNGYKLKAETASVSMSNGALMCLARVIYPTACLRDIPTTERRSECDGVARVWGLVLHLLHSMP